MSDRPTARSARRTRPLAALVTGVATIIAFGLVCLAAAPASNAATGTASGSAAHASAHVSIDPNGDVVTSRPACPARFTFGSVIRSHGPATVRYYWRSGTGSHTPLRTLRFRGAGHHSHAVHDTLTVSGDADTWRQLVIVSPVLASSTLMPYAAYCLPDVAVDSESAAHVTSGCSDVTTDVNVLYTVYTKPAAGLNYDWYLDGTHVVHGAHARGSVGDHRLTLRRPLVATSGTTSHEAALEIRAADGTVLALSGPIDFTVTCS